MTRIEFRLSKHSHVMEKCNVLKELALQITAGSLISSIGQIGSIPTGVQFSLSGQGTGNSISYSPVSILPNFCHSSWDVMCLSE